MAKDETYNGWANYETWNVALWIENDESIYNYAKYFRHKGYIAFRRDLAANMVGLKIALETPDGVSWNDSKLDIEELNKMLEEL